MLLQSSVTFFVAHHATTQGIAASRLNFEDTFPDSRFLAFQDEFDEVTAETEDELSVLTQSKRFRRGNTIHPEYSRAPEYDFADSIRRDDITVILTGRMGL